MTHQLTINETEAFIYIFGWEPTQKSNLDYTPIFTEIMDDDDEPVATLGITEDDLFSECFC